MGYLIPIEHVLFSMTMENSVILKPGLIAPNIIMAQSNSSIGPYAPFSPGRSRREEGKKDDLNRNISTVADVKNQ